MEAVRSKKSSKKKTEKSKTTIPESSRVDQSNTPVLEAPVRVDPPVTAQAAASSEVAAQALGDNIESYPGPEAASSDRSKPEDISAETTEQLQDLNLPETALEGPSTSIAEILRRSKCVAAISDDSDSSSDRGLFMAIDYSKKTQTSSSESTSIYDSARTTPSIEDSNGEHATTSIASSISNITALEEPIPSTCAMSCTEDSNGEHSNGEHATTNISNVTISEEPIPSTTSAPETTDYPQLDVMIESPQMLALNTRILKIIFLGDVGVGKTSIVHRIVDGVFIKNYYQPTIGVDFRIKSILISDNVVARLLIYDIAGRERTTDLARIYYRRANGAFIVFDRSSENHYRSAVKWKEQLDNTVSFPDGSKIPCVLLGNKSDLAKSAIDDWTMANFLQTHGFAKFFETSAKDGTGINEAVQYLIQQMAAQVEEQDLDVIRPGDRDGNFCTCAR